MRILVFENITDTGLGGQERSLFEICEILAQRRFEITLAYRQGGNLLPRYQCFIKDAIRVNQYQIEGRKIGHIVTDLARLVAGYRKHRWQLLYISQYFDSAFAAILSRILRLPLVCHLRLPAPSYLSRQYLWGLSHCQRLIAISEATKQGYVDLGIPAAAIEVVYNGIDTALFTPSNRPLRRVKRNIVYLGRLCPEKGLETLVRAMLNLGRRRDDIILRLFGDDFTCTGDRRFLSRMKMLAGSELGRSIRFCPHAHDVVPILRSADLLVLPSEWDEPFGRVLIEAMACEVPVIGTHCGGIPEVLSPQFSDHLVPVQNVERLAERIDALIDWRDTQPDLGQRCRRLVIERFGRDRLAREISAIFHAVGVPDHKPGAISSGRVE